MKSREAKITQVISNGICVVFTLCALLPFILLFVGSFTDNAWALEHGFTFFPQKFSVEAYRYILDKWQLIGRDDNYSCCFGDGHQPGDFDVVCLRHQQIGDSGDEADQLSADLHHAV